MKALRKHLLLGAVIAGLGVSGGAMAGPWGGPGPRSMGENCPTMGGGGGFGAMMGGEYRMGPRQRQAMMRQHHAERMELLAARLKLKPEQEAGWQSFLNAQDTHRRTKFEAIRAMRRNRPDTVQGYFDGRVQLMEQNLASMKTLNKALADFYTTLDPAQKQVMDKFFTERPNWQGRGGRRAMANDAPPQAGTPEGPADSANTDDSDE